MTREEIATKYSQQYIAMHEEFFETIHQGTPQQERVLREGKLAADLNTRNAEITANYEAELIAEGFEGLEPVAEPPHSTHVSILENIAPSKARPARIKRTWEGKDYFYDCFVTESVKDQYLAGDVAVGDYVVVFWSDIGEQIVTAKVFKSW